MIYHVKYKDPFSAFSAFSAVNRPSAYSSRGGPTGTSFASSSQIVPLPVT
jgi:hypothetical protein